MVAYVGPGPTQPGDLVTKGYVDTSLATWAVSGSITGTYAARPAATAVVNGAIYYCTNIPEAYRSNGTTWTVVQSGGNQLGYAVAGGISTASTTPIDVPGMSVTFIAGERPIQVQFTCESAMSIAESIATYTIKVNASVIGQAVSRGIGADEWRTLSKSATARGLTPGVAATATIQMKSSYSGATARVNTPELLIVTL